MEYLIKGLTEVQQRQVEYLLSLEPYENLTRPFIFDVYCRDCKEGKEFRSVQGAISFIHCHAGHRTWVRNLGRITIRLEVEG